jgi:16S rRNA (adenine1518-N6/adenine1519-N6)-dimethyltransferase
MIQKEVAIRITQRDNKASLLSVITNFYANIKYLKTVPKADFKPIPKVDSALIEITPKKYNKEIEDIFLKIVKQGFLHKRKQLFKNLKQIIKEDNLKETFDKLNIPFKVRAEELSTQT